MPPRYGTKGGKVLSSRSKGKKSEVTSEELKERILEVARRHFARHGFQGANLKNIAEEAEVANSLINYHFEDKAGLLKAAMEPFARRRMEAVARILDEPRSLEEMRVRLELFVEEMLASVIENPHGHEIIDREVNTGNPIVLKIFEATLLKSFKSVVSFFQAAKNKGLIRKDLDPLIISGLLFTSSCDVGRKEHLAKTFFNISLEDADWRKKFAQHVVVLFMSGVCK